MLARRESRAYVPNVVPMVLLIHGENVGRTLAGLVLSIWSLRAPESALLWMCVKGSTTIRTFPLQMRKPMRERRMPYINLHIYHRTTRMKCLTLPDTVFMSTAGSWSDIPEWLS